MREGLIKEAKGLAGSLKLERGIEKAVLNAPITAFDVGHFHETGEKRSSMLARAIQTYITQGEFEGYAVDEGLIEEANDQVKISWRCARCPTSGGPSPGLKANVMGTQCTRV